LLTVEKYSLALVFYSLLGVILGLGRSCLDADRRGLSFPHKGMYLFGACSALVYGFLGIGIFEGGHSLYIYLPVVLLWWGGGLFGSSLFPISERGIGIPVTLALGMAVLLFHTVL
jgi:hypothetical protein